ncbi:hypothetical protein FQ775_15650 [Nitratireductor mangrovi]|uniref:Uncharacterized protein n=1 Tax=Nitratireductor mangrovi TaxID=2599600 RepID=A0A5B8L2D7_9HYPH|nr:hypothetical protein [Nitratireductor mangrovi]QDZ01688.1 hypothetical protein FQ775_15650 [Nitratireductor mangrovi]
MPLFAFILTATVLTASPAAGGDWSATFVEAFRAACVPQRLSYEGTLAQASAEGWSEFAPADHAEFGAVMAKADAALKAEAAEMEIDYRGASYAREVGGRPLHLFVSLVETEYLNAVGCYLYDFEAGEPVRAAAVSNVLGIKPAQSHSDDALVATVWGPPPSMPRTLDTHLIFIPAGSPHAETTSFDGVVLKFETSVPGKEGER